MPIWLVVALLVSVLFFGFLVWRWWSEYRFYKKQNWDFLIENPKASDIVESGPSRPWGKKSNRRRVKLTLPFGALITFLMILDLSYVVYRIQTCETDDLKKCGIEVHASEVVLH